MQSEPVRLETGPITHAEARQMVARFNASHWNDGREKARYTIPADPRRDDDIRLHAYIDQMEALTARATAAESRVRELEASIDALAEKVDDYYRALSAATSARNAPEGTYDDSAEQSILVDARLALVSAARDTAHHRTTLGGTKA